MSLTFNVTPGASTPSQQLPVTPGVVSIGGTAGVGSEVIIEASHDDSLWRTVISQPVRLGPAAGVLSIPPIPAGWHVRVTSIGDFSGIVVIG